MLMELKDRGKVRNVLEEIITACSLERRIEGNVTVQ
jgi:hypothetical protein